MAQLKAFSALRLKEKWAKEVAALPYDVMSMSEAKQMIEGHPYSFLNIDKPEIHVHEKGEAPYLYASTCLTRFIADGLYEQDQESLYIYELESSYAHQYGLVGLVDTKEYEAGMIKKHEHTRSDKEDDRMQHILHCRAHTGPIFLVEQDLKGFGDQLISFAISQKPILDVTFEDGVSHRIYQISHQETIQELITLFKMVPALYIADGHHRAAAAARVAHKLVDNEEARSFLAVIFPKEQLHILAYHRVLMDESHLTKSELFQKLYTLFDIDEIAADVYLPTAPHTFGMRYQKKWYKLSCRPLLYENKAVEARLDAAILQREVLEPLFKIKDPKNDPRIDFVPGIRNAEILNRRTDEEMDIAFSLYPTRMEELIAVADMGGLMPPKSTWFEPKLRSGFFVHRF